MKQFDYVIRDKLGLHARAAAKLARYAQTSACDIYIQKDRKIVDMKNVMGLISLKALKNDKVSVFVNGEREEEVVEDMKRYMGRIYNRVSSDSIYPAIRAGTVCRINAVW